jgi:hypothetical protein
VGDEGALSHVIDLMGRQDGSRILCPKDNFGDSPTRKITKRKMKIFGKLKVVWKTNKAFLQNR